MKLHILYCCRNEIQVDAFRGLMMASVDAADYWKSRFGKESTVEIKVAARMHVVDGRAKLTEDAINEGADYVMWFDDDMLPPVDTVERLMKRLDEDPALDYVGALAYKKNAPYGPCAFVAPADRDSNNWVRRLPERVQPVGITGFACLLCRVPSLKKVWDATEGHPFVYTKHCGEDAYFFNRAADIGQRVAVDTSVVVGHVGTHVVDSSTFEEYLKHHPEIEARLA
mgnify:CR=1 FL=1